MEKLSLITRTIESDATQDWLEITSRYEIIDPDLRALLAIYWRDAPDLFDERICQILDIRPRISDKAMTTYSIGYLSTRYLEVSVLRYFGEV